jgi:serine/threonine protein kinase
MINFMLYWIGHLTAKSDVYSFGVVFLEILSGLRVIDKNRPSGRQNLVEWAKPYLNKKQRIFRVLDVRLEGQYSLDSAQKAANLALQCLAVEARNRPNMDGVVTALEELQVTPKSDEKEPQVNGHSLSNGMPVSCRDSVKEDSKFTVYPRPSANLVHP